MGAGLIAIALAAYVSNPMALAGGAALCGGGFGLFQLANNRALFFGTPADRSNATGGLQGTARLGGQTLGTFLVAALFVSLPQQFAPIGAAVAGAGFAIVAALLSLAAGRAPSRFHTTIRQPPAVVS